ncbi:MAG: DUF5683 domain-containing protein [candidate division KSB1 bacterium]|nr:DUF5683 domain-containing protein [candidate division KSB1 bacterium]
MNGNIKTLVAGMALSGLFVITPAIYAQDGSTNGKNAVNTGIVISSIPQGTLVYLKGEFEFFGRTPLVLPYKLFGKYRIKAYKNGYETVNTVYDFTGEKGGTFMVKLRPKTRTKAFARSLLFPGWGQYYSSRKTSGTLFLTATMAALVMVAADQNQYQKALNQYDQALVRFQRESNSFEEQKAAFDDLQRAITNVENKRNQRNISAAVVAGIWLLNALESVLFFPDFSSQIEFFNNFSAKAELREDNLALVLRYRF